MRLLLLLLLLLALAACSDDPVTGCIIRGGVARCGGWPGTDGGENFCNPLSQIGCEAGQKCTWIIDQTNPQYAGHVACVPDGTAAVGEACSYGAPGATGFDNCTKGSVCSAFAHTGQPGVCKQICDDQGGAPTCDATHACVMEEPLFSTGASSPAAAGLCETSCDPLADNDFDGPGSALSRTGSACGSAAEIGCYGLPSEGTTPATAFTCMPELHYTTPLHHRSECTTATGCADTYGNIAVNSCNQGYLPLFRESTAVSTVVCIALCKPLDCYAGNCGSNNANRLGEAPHRCASPDALGAFGSGEECEYLWHEELAGSDWLPSPYSDSVGICIDHDAYGMARCEDLPLVGSGSAVGAADLGCVSSQLANPRMVRRR